MKGDDMHAYHQFTLAVESGTDLVTLFQQVVDAGAQVELTQRPERIPSFFGMPPFLERNRSLVFRDRHGAVLMELSIQEDGMDLAIDPTEYRKLSDDITWIERTLLDPDVPPDRQEWLANHLLPRLIKAREELEVEPSATQ